MFFELVIPTLDRLGKLLDCLQSIRESDKGDNRVDVYVYFNTQKEVDFFNKFSESEGINLRVFENYRVPNFWNSHLAKSKADVMACLNDDTLLKVDTILEIEKAFNENFPDFDGIIGLNQCNGPKEQCLDSAFCAIGLKYAKRFPENKVSCPNYYRFFGDKEIGLYAKEIDRFYFAENAKIIHRHPAFTQEGGDETHYKVRQYLQKDKAMFNNRQSLGLLWGRDYKLLKESN